MGRDKFTLLAAGWGRLMWDVPTHARPELPVTLAVRAFTGDAMNRGMHYAACCLAFLGGVGLSSLLYWLFGGAWVGYVVVAVAGTIFGAWLNHMLNQL